MCMVRRAKYLTDNEAPIVYAGLMMAQALDRTYPDFSTNLITEYNRHCRYILAMAPKGSLEDDLSKFLVENIK